MLTPQEDKPDGGSYAGQFGALCYRTTEAGDTEILLITTRGTKRWSIPKGWPMEGRKPHQVAELEAWEEAGVVGSAKKRSYGRYDYLKKISGGDRVQAVVDLHVLESTERNGTFQSAANAGWRGFRPTRRLVWWRSRVCGS